jgi:LysM repeat protein
MSRGRHRQPSNTAHNAAALVSTGAVALIPVALSTAHAEAAEPAPSVNWGPIVSCESGGNPHAQNASSTASGLYQFLDSSWKAYGGTKFGARAKDASAAQQTQIANIAFQKSGLSPWTASRGCWGGKVSSSPTHESSTTRTVSVTTARAAHSSGASAPKHALASRARHAAPEKTPDATPTGGSSYTVLTGDTLSGIAAARGLSWQSVWQANKASVPQANMLHPGQQLHLPTAAETAPTPTRTAPAAVPAPAAERASTGKHRAVSVAPQKLASAPQAVPATHTGPTQPERIWLTGYSYQDNTPAGSATVSHPILHKDAGGTGTFTDPITVAVPGQGHGIWTAGSKFYLPTVKRYVIVEDTGASAAPAGQDGHLDMWIGGQGGTKSATDNCMDKITGTNVPATFNPPPNLPVIDGPVWDQACHVPS